MCGRFTLFEPDKVLAREFGVSDVPRVHRATTSRRPSPSRQSARPQREAVARSPFSAGASSLPGRKTPRSAIGSSTPGRKPPTKNRPSAMRSDAIVA